jgi:hypothetical protein
MGRPVFASKKSCDSTSQTVSFKAVDKNGKSVKIGDYVISHREHVTSDGYLRRGYPKKIRIICLVVYNHVTFGFEFRQVCVHPDDQKYVELYQYRAMYNVDLSVDWDNELQNYRDDFRVSEIELIEDSFLIEYAANNEFDFRGRLKDTQ